ncbi:MAG TPA: ABC transporter substrate-binding protein [Acidimicrobiia bacterium]
MRENNRPRRRLIVLTAVFAVFAVIIAACGGGSSGKSSNSSNNSKPKAGGKITYGLEAITTSFCLPSAQLSIAGIIPAEAVYDTLTEPDASGKTVPYLAKSVTHNSTYDQWTITLRPGISFTDGEPLNAAAVKQNIDAWRKGLLLSFVFTDIANVTTPNDMTVVVQLKRPWVVFDGYLWSTGRVGIAAPAQLNNTATCDRNMIGTGPFKLKNGPSSYDPTTGSIDVVKNPNYWRKGYPLLDEIQFKAVEDSQIRTTQLQGGQLDVEQDDTGKNLNTIEGLSNISVEKEPAGYRELGHGLINVQRAPLSDLRIRKAVAEGTDRNALNQINNAGKWDIANGVLDSKVLGYVSDPGLPQYNPSDAKKQVASWKADHNGATPTFALATTTDAIVQQLAQEIQSEMKKIGINVTLPTPVLQSALINDAIAGHVDAFLWRNYPGLDPDGLYVWFHSGSTVNFNHLNDPEIDHDLDMGRITADTSKRAGFYSDLDKRMSSQVYNLWNWYETWFIAHNNNVQGILGPNLPDANGAVGNDKPADILAGYHQLIGMYRS